MTVAFQVWIALAVAVLFVRLAGRLAHWLSGLVPETDGDSYP